MWHFFFKNSRRLIAGVFYVCLCCCISYRAVEAAYASSELTGDMHQKPLAVYATQMAHPNTNTAFIEATHRALADAFAPRKVTFEMLPIAELDKVVNERKANVVMAGAGFYRRHLHEGLRDIATVVSPLQPNADRAVGSTVVTLKNRDDIRSLEDLKGKNVSANAPIGFQGILIVKNELSKKGFNPERFFKKEFFVGMDLLPSIDLLRQGKVDAAILTSCLMEESRVRGMKWPDELKVIGEKEQSDVACKVSTDLYPNWSILLTPTIDPETTRKIVATIHAMPKSPEGIEWAVATDFSLVDDMYRRLKIGPYKHLREWTLQRLVKEYGPWLAVSLFVLVALVVHSILISYLVRQRTSQLSEALRLHKEQSEMISSLSERYETVRRAAAVSQISSIIAHELSQPIAGITLYAEGLKNILRSSGLTSQTVGLQMMSAIEKISARAQKADRIVQSVRNRAKDKENTKSKVDLTALLRELRHDFAMTTTGKTAVLDIKVPAINCPIYANDFEIKLALLNLLRNSTQAPRNEKKCRISVVLDVTDGGNYLITVSDNALPVDEKLVQRLNDPVVSVKDDGLGLGLSIVRSIVESHFGKLSFGLSPTHGLEVRILLPEANEVGQSANNSGL